MALPPEVEGYFRLVEARRDIGGRFVNLKRIGVGTFSLVFSALDQVSNRPVAIKVFHPKFLTDRYRFECFCREESLLERLGGCKNVLGWVAARDEFIEQMQSATGISVEFRFPYFAVELGYAAVSEAIMNRSWSAEQKLMGFRDMCKAVQRVHRESIAHRDIKPGNFLIMTDGSTKLSDFGAARDMAASRPALMPNYMFSPGDIRYSPPEMLALLHDAEPGIAFYGDFYALGATLYELWSGVVLGVQMFDRQFALDLTQSMQVVNKADRMRTYQQFLPSIVSGHPLPGIGLYGRQIPSCIAREIEDLYKLLCALDYRMRLCDFERIFLRIGQCLLVLRNEEKVQKWRQQKEVYKANRQLKCLRMQQRAGLLVNGRG